MAKNEKRFVPYMNEGIKTWFFDFKFFSEIEYRHLNYSLLIYATL